MKKIYAYIALLPLLLLPACDINTQAPDEAFSEKVPLLSLWLSDNAYQSLAEGKFTNVAVGGTLDYNGKSIPCKVEPQGAGSRYFSKWGYYITSADGTPIETMTYFNLSTQPYDKSLIRTALTNEIFKRLGFITFNTTHAFLKINNSPQGLYVVNEKITQDFFSKRNVQVDELIKVVFGAKFTFNGGNNLSDVFEKKIPDDRNLNNLADFIHELDITPAAEITENIGKLLDIDHYLKYHAVSMIINNTDGLTNNFYLLKTKDDRRYHIVPWDFDKSFSIGSSLSMYESNDISAKLFLNQECLNRYKSIVKEIISDHFTENALYPVIDSVYNKIKDDYYLDPAFVYKKGQLEEEVRLLKSFITSRRNELIAIENE
jgi:spore coat protein H